MTEMKARTAQLPEKGFKNTSPNKGLRLMISLSHTLHDGVLVKTRHTECC